MKKIFALLLGLLFCGSVMADNIHIAVVDLQKIVQSSGDMQQIQDKLEKQFKARRDQLIVTEADLKRDMEKFNRDSAVMSQSERKTLDKKINDTRQGYERDAQQYQQELNAAHNQAMEEFYNRIRAAISKVAARDKYDVVLQKDAAPFSADSLDITAKVMQEMTA